MVLTEVVERGSIDLPTAIERLSSGPARILGLEEHGGPVAPGRPANLMVFDPASEWRVGDHPFHSMARNCAFIGRTVRGRVVHTLLRGSFTVREGTPTR